MDERPSLSAPAAPARREPLAARVVTHGLGLVSAVLLFTMMVVTVVDVIGRYWFGSPLRGAFEANQIMLGVIIYAGLPAVCLHQEHVSVGLLTDRLGPWPRRILGALLSVAGAAVMALVAYQLWRHGARLARFADVTTFLRFPLAPVAWAMCGLSAASGLLLLVNAWLIAAGRVAWGQGAREDTFGRAAG